VMQQCNKTHAIVFDISATNFLPCLYQQSPFD
jgi:hypothetical protein